MKKTGLALLLLLALLLPALAMASSYSIADYAMVVDVQADGTGLFFEALTYDFDGEHNGFLVDIRHDADVQVKNLRLTVDGGRVLEQVDALDGVPYTYTAADNGRTVSIKAFAPGTGSRRTLTLTYEMGGVALRYRDTARINQLLLSGGAAFSRAQVTIHLPGSGDGEILAYVHGAMNASQLEVDGHTIRLGPAAIGNGDKLEAHILFPEAWLSSARTIDQDMYDFALAAEAEAQGSTFAIESPLALVLIVIAPYVLFILAAVIVFLRLSRKYGIKHVVIPSQEFELLDTMPAAMAQVIKEDSITSSGLCGTLIELTQKGILTMENTDDGVCFTLTGQEVGLLPHQAMLLEWLFENRKTYCIDQMDAGDDYEAATAFTNQYNAWKTQVIADTRGNGWLYDNQAKRMLAMCGFLFVPLLFAVFLLRYGLWPFAIPGFVLGILACFAFSRIRKITDAGERQLAAINGFLINYEDKLAQSPDFVLSRVPLVMALGYIEPLADWMDRQPDGYDGWDASPWMYVGWHHSVIHMSETVRDAQSHNAGTQSTGSASGGGGFTGGSGGSSHGAW